MIDIYDGLSGVVKWCWTSSKSVGLRSINGVLEMTELKPEGYLKSRTILALGVWLCFAVLCYFVSTGVSLAKGAPESFAPLAERLLPAVVNISTTQNLKREDRSGTPNLPQGSPLEEYFKEFFGLFSWHLFP